MKAFLLLCCLLSAAVVIYADTDINFFFGDKFRGSAGGPSSDNSCNNYPSNGNAEDAYNVEQTILGFFNINDLASNDPPVNVVFDKYAPLITPFARSSIVLTTTSSIVNNGVASTFNGIAGVVNYLRAIADTRNSSIQFLTNLRFDFANSDSVIVNANYYGFETLNSDFSGQSFYGRRTYQLFRDRSGEYGWKINSVNIVRLVTVASASNFEDFNGVEQTVLGFFAINDVASNDPPANVVFDKYAPLVAPFSSPSIVLTTTSTIVNNGVPTTFNGIAGVVNYLRAIADTRNSSIQFLTNIRIEFTSSDSATVSANYNGYETVNSNFSAYTFYGRRTYQLSRNSAGQYGWVINSVNIVRLVTTAAASDVASPYSQRSYTLEYVERGTTDTFISTGANGVGDTDYFDNDLYDATNTVRIGGQIGSCARSNGLDKWFCRYEVNLGGADENDLLYVYGSLWEEANKVAIIAVIGGTGIYRQAFGTALVWSALDFSQPNNIRFFYLKFTAQDAPGQFDFGVNRPVA